MKRILLSVACVSALATSSVPAAAGREDGQRAVPLLRVHPLAPVKSAIANRFSDPHVPGENEVVPTHVPTLHVLNSFRKDWRDPLAFFSEVSGKYGPVARGRLPTGHDAFFLSDAKGIDSVLKATDRGDDSPFEKSELLQDPLASFAGRKGMFTDMGALWKRQRSELSFFFRPTHIQEAQMASEMNDVIQAHVDSLRQRLGEVKSGSRSSAVEVDLADELTDLTLEVLLTTLFHPRTVGPEERARVREAFHEISGALPFDIVNPTNIGISRLPPVSPRQFRLRAAYKVMDDLVDRIVHDRIKTPRTTDPDVLDAMLDTTYDGVSFRQRLQGGAKIPRELRDQVLTMVLAGHETTASTLTFAFHELSRSKETLTRLRAELDQLPPMTGTPDAVRGTVMMLVHGNGKLPFIGQVVNETLRLYSPAWVVARRARTDTTVPLKGGKVVFVPKDAQVLMPLFVSQRMEDTWGTEKTGYPADKFHPERFDAQNLASHGLTREDTLFTPFGAGRRVCLGEHFATLEAKLILAQFLRTFHVHAKSSDDPRLRATIGLRIEGGLPARLSARTD